MSNSELYYSFSPKKGYRVICLDSIIDYKLTSNGEIHKKQLDWLKEQLDKYRKDVIILCTHVPIEEPYPSANHKLNNDDELKNLLGNYTNPIIVLQGHYHCVRAKQKDNIIYISSPSLVTFPNAFRVININSNKKRTLVDVFLKETNLKDVQSRSKLRLFGVESLYGTESDRNTTFVIKNDKE
jgi:3',5'-cyclic AMP phosphodiesterase CpdA